MANYQAGQINLASGGAIGFTPNKFAQPPIVVISVVSNQYDPINVHITNTNKDSFGYTVKYANGGRYRPRVGDKLNWLAIC
jgi:hypothetical protein